MKSNISLIIFIFFICFFFHEFPVQAQPAPNFGAKGGFTNIPKRMLLKQGTLQSADALSLYTNALPVGDGTYYFQANLIQGADYNFIFQSRLGSTWQYEQLPPQGSFPTSVDLPGGVTDLKGGRIIKTSDNNIRRKITVPTAGGAYYVFCNFGHHPNPPVVTATPSDSKVILSIKSIGRWGYAEPDVEFGGRYVIYSSTMQGGPYQYVDTISAGNGFPVKYTNSGLTNSSTYYYVVMAYDSYGGTNSVTRQGPFEKEVALPDNGSYVDQLRIDANMFSGYSSEMDVIPKAPVKVIFKVENIDWEVVEEKDHLVYLTPLEMDGRYWFDKQPARIVRVRME